MNAKIVEKLREIQELCVKHQDYSSGATVERLLREYDDDQHRFWDSLTSDAVWGGAGSIADQCLSTSKTFSAEELQQDRRVVWRALAEIAREMKAAGRVNERTESWASAFRSWLRQGI